MISIDHKVKQLMLNKHITVSGIDADTLSCIFPVNDGLTC